MKLSIAFCSIFLVMTHLRPSCADDNWSQWRGPLNSGVSESAEPPVTWSETENIKWKVGVPASDVA